ncbi:MAG: hypothetical protein IJJ76_03575 [Ruminococcus sp.]|uniref:hypothetical protein n=1 Tax=Ruminococcus sp. TaxID=41978 RepID=UPI0025FE58EC|nr:hypothetical protein [Ruminococcus sp.]MBR0528831.1 hypothetical protein [Ruminococcus sp.]
MDLSDVLYEVIFPALVYFVLGAAGIIGAVISRKAKKELKQTAVYVSGKVIGYKSYRNGYGRFVEHKRDITVVCVPPDSAEEAQYTITTCGHFTFKYRWVKNVRLTFTKNGAPLLPEDVGQLSFNGIAGLIAGGVLILTALAFVICYVFRVE